MKHLAIWLFVSLGGVGLIFKMVKDNLPGLIDRAFGLLVKNPSIKEFVWNNRERIKAIVDEIAAELDREIDATKPLQ